MRDKIIVIVTIVILVILIQGVSLYFFTRSEESVQEPVKKTPVAPKQSFLPQQPFQPATNISTETAVQEGFNVGEKASDFVFQLITGEIIIKNRVLKERPLVVYFFTTYCIPCLEELEQMEEIYPAYKSRIRFIAMSTDPTEGTAALEKFRKTYRGFASLIDLAPRKQETLITFQATSPGLKIALNKKGIITARDETEFDHNEWRNLFNTLV